MLFILGTVVSIVTHLLSRTLYIVFFTLYSEIIVSKEMRDWREIGQWRDLLMNHTLWL